MSPHTFSFGLAAFVVVLLDGGGAVHADFTSVVQATTLGSRGSVVFYAPSSVQHNGPAQDVWQIKMFFFKFG